MHKQAAKNTMMVLLAGLMAGAGIGLIVNYVPIQAILWIGGIAFIAYMVKIMYSIEKSRLETLEILNKKG